MDFTVFELADAYYGWRFGPAFTDQLAGSGAHAGGCGGGLSETPASGGRRAADS